MPLVASAFTVADCRLSDRLAQEAGELVDPGSGDAGARRARRSDRPYRGVVALRLTSQPPTRSQTVTRLALGAMMTFAGVSHLTFAREEFQAQVPEWVPVNDDLVVVGSGVVEIGLGVALLTMQKRRRLTGLALAGFFVAIFPGNVAQYLEGTDAFGLDTDTKRLVRLFGQPLLVGAALWAAGIPERPSTGSKGPRVSG